MKIIKPGNLPAPRPTLYDFDYTCPRCGAVLRLETGDSVMTERSIDGASRFFCAYCQQPMAVVWDGVRGAFIVVQP